MQKGLFFGMTKIVWNYDVCITLNIVNATELNYFKRVNFMVCNLYITKKLGGTERVIDKKKNK